MKPSEYPEVHGCPNLRRLLEIQVDMQFADIGTMLQLPNSDAGLDAGCNLALANVLFSMISGASVFFFNADLGYLERHNPNQSSARFKGVLRKHYPWRDNEAFGLGKRRDVIYQYGRNPIVHSFGVGKSARLFPGVPRAAATPVYIEKGPLDAGAADLVMAGAEPAPVALPLTLRRERDAAVLSVVGLAWGTAAMLRSLFRDAEQADRAETLARQILNPRPPTGATE
ncbi:MAG: hypothetical protein AB7V58_18250 [Solirubrobacterales bacterium]